MSAGGRASSGSSASGSRSAPARDQDGVAVASAGGVGVLVGPHAHAFVPGTLDESDCRLARTPVGHALRLDVRRDDPHPGPPPDLDRLHDRVLERRRTPFVLAWQIPHRVRPLGPLVRDVHAIVVGQLRRQLDQLVGRAPAPGRVFEPGRHPHRAFLQRLPHQRRHLPGLRRGRGPLEVVLHDHPPHGPVAHHHHHVRPHPLPLQRRALIGHRPRRAPVLVHHDRRHPLRHDVGRRLAVCGVVADRPAAAVAAAVVRVGMDVDEPGGHVAARGVDLAVGGGPGQVPQRGDPPVDDTDVGAEPGVAGAVEDPPAAHDQVEVTGVLGGEGGGGGRKHEGDEGAGEQETTMVKHGMADGFGDCWWGSGNCTALRQGRPAKGNAAALAGRHIGKPRRVGKPLGQASPPHSRAPHVGCYHSHQR